VPEDRGKALAFAALDGLRITSLWGRFARGVPILAYHGVTALPDDRLRNRRRLHVTAQRFTEHLQELKRYWQPVALRELVEAFRAARPLPERAAVVTFDDGYRNVMTVAAPLLAHFSVPFTLFVMTEAGGSRLWVDRVETAVLAAAPGLAEWRGLALDLREPEKRARSLHAIVTFLDALGDSRKEAIDDLVGQLRGELPAADDDRDLLDWAEVRAMRAAGVEIGAHADRHERLSRRSEDELRPALRACRATLERRLGPGPYTFCYPYGDWDARIAAAVREAGFNAALTTDSGLNRPSQSLFSLRRFLMGADDDVPRLRAALCGLRALFQRGHA